MSDLQNDLLATMEKGPEKAEKEDLPFVLARDLTLAYAGSTGSGQANIPLLFVELYRLFKQGKAQKGADIA